MLWLVVQGHGIRAWCAECATLFPCDMDFGAPDSSVVDDGFTGTVGEDRISLTVLEYQDHSFALDRASFITLNCDDAFGHHILLVRR